MTGAMSTPATAPTTAASTHDAEYTRSTLMPMRRAAVWFCATARMARPKRVARKSAHEGQHQDERGPDDAQGHRRDPHRAERDGPVRRTARGTAAPRSSTRCPAAARRASESPSVMISTSQWVAERARRMIARSTRSARSPPAATPQASAASSGSPAVCWADQRHERGDHEHLALGEVHGAGRVVDDDEAQRDQRVDAARREPADDDVDQRRAAHARILLGRLAPVKTTSGTGTDHSTSSSSSSSSSGGRASRILLSVS